MAWRISFVPNHLCHWPNAAVNLALEAEVSEQLYSYTISRLYFALQAPPDARIGIRKQSPGLRVFSDDQRAAQLVRSELLSRGKHI
jgi:hypothetical protein